MSNKYKSLENKDTVLVQFENEEDRQDFIVAFIETLDPVTGDVTGTTRAFCSKFDLKSDEDIKVVLAAVDKHIEQLAEEETSHEEDAEYNVED